MHQDENLDIAIIGFSGRFPGAPNTDVFWKNLCAGKESIRFFTEDELVEAGVPDALRQHPDFVPAAPVLDDVAAFDARFFGYTPREARMTDPQQRLLLQEAWRAFEHAGYNPSATQSPVSVFVGSAMNTYLLFSGLLPQFVDAYLPTLIGSDKDFLATRISYKLNLRGPSVTVQTACSTALVSVHMACQSLLNDECDMALAGAVSVRVPHHNGHLYTQGSVFTPDGHCRPFDASANGTIFGSGVGAVILKRIEDAIADGDTIHAVIKGSAINNDGASKADYTAPSIQSQSDAITEALAVSGVDADTISYVEAHGTGTYLGDPIEVAALTRAYQAYTKEKGYCAIGSVKSNIGHLDAAAGMAGLIKTVLALKYKTLPPTIHFESPNPEIDFPNTPFFVNDQLNEWKHGPEPRRAGVSALGIGGTNAHVILEEAPAMKETPASPHKQLLLLSARTSEALDEATTQLANYLTASTSSFDELAFTLQTGRKAFEHRRFLIADQAVDAAKALQSNDEERLRTLSDAPLRHSVVFMCSGQGSQYVGMGRGLYESQPVFREWIDRCAALLQPALGEDLRNILYPQANDETAADKLKQTALTQPALFAVEYAMAQLWMHWGIQPAALIGHSIGEYVAACLAGVFSLEDALQIVAERGRLMQALPAGQMLAVQAPAESITTLFNDQVDLAAVNSPTATVLSGESAALDAVSAQLEKAGHRVRPLHTSHAFHSRMMEPMLADFEAFIARKTLAKPSKPVVSNVTGTWLTDEQATSPAYWTQHVRSAVLFADGITKVLEEPGRLLLEIGPGNTLASLTHQHSDLNEAHSVVASMRHPKDDVADDTRALEALGRLWMHGIEIDWPAVHDHAERRRVPAPTYPFAREPHWYETAGSTGNPYTPASTTASPSTRQADLADWFYVPSWKRAAKIAEQAHPSPARYLVFANDDDFSDSLLAALQAAGHDVTPIRPGNTFDFNAGTIDPGASDHYIKLADAFGEAGCPERILHLWCTGTPRDDEKQHAFYSQLYLAQALWQKKAFNAGGIQVGIVAHQVMDVSGDETVDAIRSLVLGPAGVLPKEMPGYRGFVLDAGVHGPEQVMPALEHLYQANNPHAIVALRGGYFWAPHYEATPLHEAEPKLQEKGVYLITGGFGGVGGALASSLASRVQARLALAGRSPMPPRDEWKDILEKEGVDHPIVQKINAILALEEAGAEVLPVQADITDPKAVREMVKTIHRAFGDINGVIHAAGVIEDTLTPLKSTESAERVLAAKVEGTRRLAEVVAQDEPDFFALCSSVNAMLSPAGQIDYSAANRFLDAFAATNTSIRTLSINWPGWSEVGMLARQAGPGGEKPAWLKAALHSSVPTERGVEAFYRALASGESNVIVSPVSFPDGHQVHHASTPQIQVGGDGARVPTKVPVNNGQGLQRALQEVWQDVLGITSVAPHDNFFDLGGNSLMAITLFAEIERRVGKLNLPLSALLEAPTIARFSKLIGQSKESEDRWSPLVTIQEGTGTPIFCCHGAGGNVLIYQQLAQQLGPDQTVYGFQSAGLDGGGAMRTTIAEMAALYVEEVKRLVPANKGPVVLVGYCMGGTIAWEMAQQLKADGYLDPTVIMLETYNWINLSKDNFWEKTRHLTEKIQFHSQNYFKLKGDDRKRFFEEKLRVLSRRKNIWMGQAREAFGLKSEPTHGIDQEALARVWRTNDDAALAYELEPYGGPVVHIRPQRDYACHSGKALGFDPFAENLETIRMPVYPAGMLIPPFVSTLAEQIRVQISQAQENWQETKPIAS